MALTVQTAAATEPLTLAEAKLDCRVDADAAAEDSLITELIQAAREFAEKVTDDRQFVTQTWNWTLEDFPDSKRMKLPRPPLQSITHIKYYDTTNTQQTFSSASYHVVVDASQPGFVQLATGIAWPSVYDRPDAVEIRFIAGYGAASAVPAGVKKLMRLLIAHWYRNREAVVTGTITKEIELAAESLSGAFSVGCYV